MLQLAGALAAPFVGAFLYGWLHGNARAVRFVDGFMFIVVPALVAWQVLPQAWAEHGALTLVVIALGIGTPALIERASHTLAAHTDNLALLAGLSGLGLHALLEGVALAPRSHMANMLPRRALSGGRLTALGATRGFTTGS